MRNLFRAFIALALATALCAPARADDQPAKADSPAAAPAKQLPRRAPLPKPPTGAAPAASPDQSSPNRSEPADGSATHTPGAGRGSAPLPPGPQSGQRPAGARQSAPAAGNPDGVRSTVESTSHITLAAVPLSAAVLYISEYTGKPVLLPDRFPGDRTVDVISSGQADVPQARAIEILATALRSVGYSMIEHASYIQIVAEGATGTTITDTPAEGFTAETLLTMVVDVKNADAKNLAPILSGLKSRAGSVAAYQDSNKLIITEQGAQLRGMLDLISKLDVKWADNVTEQLKLQNTSVEALNGVLGSYIKNLAAGADPLVKQRLSTFSVYPHAPTNSFVLFGNAQDIARVKQFIQSLDVAADPASRSYHTYYVLNRDTTDMVNVLKGVFAAVKARSGKESVGEPIPDVIPDPVNGAIILVCGPDKYKEILPLIQDLDKAKAQVQIESALVEMSMDRLLDLGVELASLDPPGSNARGFGGTTFGMSTVTAAGRTPILPTEGGLTAGIFKDKALNIAALLRLSQSDENVSFLAAPRLMATDNKAAMVKISEMREYERSVISPEGTTSAVTGGSFNEASITLEIIPHINDQGTVRLEIKQTTEQFLPSTESSTGSTLTNKTSRMAQTEVLVPEGTTAVIAGLTRTVQSKRVAKVPVLGDIPLLGFLFRRTTVTNEQRNLCVFITPTILRGAEALAAQAEVRRQEIAQTAAKAGLPSPAIDDKKAAKNGK